MKVYLLILLGLTGCNVASEKTKTADAERLAVLENRGIGRFQVLPAAGGFPPLFLDTATGCVMSITNDEELKKYPIKGPDGKLDEGCFNEDRPLDLTRDLMK